MGIGAYGVENDSVEPPTAGRWMTYDELAALRGTDRLSAVKFALRYGWRKQRDNHRVARVYVPLDGSAIGLATIGKVAAGPEATFDGRPGARPTEQLANVRVQADQARAAERALWREQLARERERVDKLERERDQVIATAKDLQNRIIASEAHADAASEDRRTAEARADAAISRALVAEGDRRSAEARADAERARAEVLDQAAAAQRCRVDSLMRQLEETEAALAAERARADRLAERFRVISGLLACRSSLENDEKPK
jgi:hypothetical protein